MAIYVNTPLQELTNSTMTPTIKFYDGSGVTIDYVTKQMHIPHPSGRVRITSPVVKSIMLAGYQYAQTSSGTVYVTPVPTTISTQTRPPVPTTAFRI